LTRPDGVTTRSGRSADVNRTLAVATRGLTKQFGQQQVVRGVDLAVPTGAVYGFLGPNGSGKTTTIRMLLGLIEPTSGERSVLGHDLPKGAAQALCRVGSLVEGPAFHPYLSGRANLVRLDAVDTHADPRTSAGRVEEALDRVGLRAAARKRYRQYSLGMRQRLAIAAALLAPRDLLILDEPTNGLDPQGTREVRSLIASLARDGATVLVSSHLLAEVEQICTHLGIISDGTLVAQGTVEEVKRSHLASVVVSTADTEQAVAVLTELDLTDVTQSTGRVTALVGEREPEVVVKALVEAGVGVRGFEVRRPSLEDVFVALTGEGFDVHH